MTDRLKSGERCAACEAILSEDCHNPEALQEWYEAGNHVCGVSKARVKDQPPPKRNSSTPIWELVVADMIARDHVGRERYGTPLQAHNGRDALVDAYQEALDLCVYLRQALEEGRSLMPEEAKALTIALKNSQADHAMTSEALRLAREDCDALRVHLAELRGERPEPPAQSKVRCAKCGFLIDKAGPCVEHSPFGNGGAL